MALDISYESIVTHISKYNVRGGTETRAFLAWFLENYYRLDESELYDYLCDGKNDKGIDGIYVNEQLKQIDIFQATLAKTDTKTQGDNRLKTFSGTIGQFDTKENATIVLSVCGPDLKALASGVHLIDRIEEGFSVRGIYVTNAKADASATTYLSTQSRIVLYDGVKLKSEFVTIAKTDPIASSFSFDITSVPSLQFPIGANLHMVLAPISARELISMEGVSNGDLFAWNVRQFLGKGTSVNKAVAESIKQAGEHRYFPAYHNGITILCKTLATSDTTIDISGYAVVNGCQSITSLYENAASITPDLRLMTKFIQVEPDSHLAGKITDHSNNQNGTTPRDLQSNNNIHLRLQTQIHAKYPEYHYRIKRGEHVTWEKNSVIENELLGRILLAFDLNKPETWSQRYKLFDELHGEIFGRPQVDEDRAIYAYETYLSVMEKLTSMDDQLFATYSLTPWLVLYLVREALISDPEGANLHAEPSLFFAQENGRHRVRICVEKIMQRVVRILNREVKRLSGGDLYFDYKKNLKNKDFITSLQARLTAQYETIIDDSPDQAFATRWEQSARAIPAEVPPE